MDPNANLAEQRRIVAEIHALYDACAEDGTFTEDQELELVSLASRLADLVQALDEWITGNGFLPSAWSVK